MRCALAFSRPSFRALFVLLPLLPCVPLPSLAADSAPWQRYSAADVVCDPEAGPERQRFWETADWGVVPGTRERLVEHCAALGGAASFRCSADLRLCQGRRLPPCVGGCRALRSRWSTSTGTAAPRSPDSSP